jgi:hypothetical protein
VEAGVGERSQRIQELDHRAWPAVGKDERERIRARRTGVQEVNAQALDLGPELPDLFEPCRATAPVVAVAPICAQLLQLGEGYTLARIRLGFRPASGAQAQA